MLYFRFILCLAIGLLGVALLMKTLLDSLFVDWDVTGDVKRMAEDLSKKRRYVRMQKETGRSGARVSATALAVRGVVDERRRVAKEKQFLASPEGMTIHAPLPPVGETSDQTAVPLG
ncbi:hypothetical protein ACFL2T_04795 [Elusimicrobiota bacterium]